MEGTKRWGHGSTWADSELAILTSSPGLTFRELGCLLPGRSDKAIRNMHARHCSAIPEVHPQVRPSGDYLETLSSYLADDFECLEIWLRWNGYLYCRELTRDSSGWVTLLCTAKG